VTTILSTPTVVSVQAASALSQLAVSMARGTWTLMSPVPSGLGIFCGGPTSGVKPGYATKMAYDAVNKKIYAFVGDHGDPQIIHFCVYSEASNSWVDTGTPPWAAVPGYHGWEHYTTESATGRLWFRPYGTLNLQRWEGGSSWTQFSYSSLFSYASSEGAVHWFPERNEIIICHQENTPNGRVAGWNPSTQTGIIHSSTLTNLGGTNPFAQYSPQHALVWMGGGTPNWILDQSGNVTAGATAPYSLGTTNNDALMVCNPANGNFITMQNATSWHDFDPVANTWTARSGTAQVLAAPNSLSDWPTFGVIAVPIFQYGVIVFIKCWTATTNAQMWLFKP